MNQTETSQTDSPALPCALPRRLLAMLYDSLAVVAVLLLATALALLAGSGQVTAGRDLLFTLYLLAAWFFYLALFWRKGMTLGMRAWRVRIEHESGGRPGWGQCLLRFLVSLASAACLGAGFWWSLFEPHKRTWHDLASRTRLLRL